MTERGEALDLVLKRSKARWIAETQLREAIRAARAKGLSLRDIADYADMSHEKVRSMSKGKGK